MSGPGRNRPGGEPPLELRETIAFDAGELRHLDAHLDRLGASAAVFGLTYDEHEIRAELSRAVADLSRGRVRLALTETGEVHVLVDPLPQPPTAPVHVTIDDVRSQYLPVHAHKSNRRDIYDQAAARHRGADDVVLVNQAGQVTESTIANLAVRIDGSWYTPPLESGALPGIGRQRYLIEGRLTEREMSVADAARADDIALISSVRGWRPATLVSRSNNSLGP